MPHFHRYIAEALGTFVLTFVVWLSLVGEVPYATPVGAALTLGMFVYTVGAISGAHVNPAITLSIWSLRRMETRDALFYIVAQIAGALLARAAGFALLHRTANVTTVHAFPTYAGEALGAFLLCFGVCSVIHKRNEPEVAGVVVGGSLLLGIYAAALFSNGVLNPAVAIGIGLFTAPYVLAPVVGACAAAWLYRYFDEAEPMPHS